MIGEERHPSLLERLLVLYARRCPIDRGKMRVVDRLWRVAAGADSRRMARLTHGALRVPCDLSELLQRQFYFFGTYFLARDVLECWSQEAVGATVVLDVGANAGIFSLAALAVAPGAAVHAFEPTAEMAVGLSATAALNGLATLHVHPVAVSDVSGRAALNRWRGEFGSNSGMHFITDDVSGGGELVPTVSLDDFCSSRGIDRIDLLKIDIQGHEHRALAGARGLLEAGRVRTIFTELNWTRGPECPATQTIQRLDAAGYRFARPAAPLQWRSAGSWMRTLSDVVARREGRGSGS